MGAEVREPLTVSREPLPLAEVEGGPERLFCEVFVPALEGAARTGFKPRERVWGFSGRGAGWGTCGEDSLFGSSSENSHRAYYALRFRMEKSHTP